MKPTFYISAALETDKQNGKTYGQAVYRCLKELGAEDLDNHMQNVWCRDYLPVKNGIGHYVQFTYAPRYMLDSEKWSKRIPKSKPLHKEIGITPTISTTILDGGNVELHKKKAIISDRVFRDNKDVTVEQMASRRASLKKELAVEELIIIPQYPYDFTGHVDGLVRFINKDTVLINDYGKEIVKEPKTYRQKLESNWYFSFIAALQNAGLQIEKLVYTAHKNDNDKSAKGIYLNFLLLEKHILLPTYNDKTADKQAQQTLATHYPNREIITIPSTELAAEGGIINCVTWSR